jgi:hypothetical protein
MMTSLWYEIVNGDRLKFNNVCDLTDEMARMKKNEGNLMRGRFCN